MKANSPLSVGLDLTGRGLIWSGWVAFAAAIAFTIFAFARPETMYGAQIPIAGFGLLALGLAAGGGLRRLAKAVRLPGAAIPQKPTV